MAKNGFNFHKFTKVEMKASIKRSVSGKIVNNKSDYFV